MSAMTQSQERPEDTQEGRVIEYRQPPRPFVAKAIPGGKPFIKIDQNAEQKKIFQTRIAKYQSERDIARHGEHVALASLHAAEIAILRAQTEKNEALDKLEKFEHLTEIYGNVVRNVSDNQITDELLRSITTIEGIKDVTRRINEDIGRAEPHQAEGMITALQHLLYELNEPKREEHIPDSETQAIPSLVYLVNYWRNKALGLQAKSVSTEQMNSMQNKAIEELTFIKDDLKEVGFVKSHVSATINILKPKTQDMPKDIATVTPVTASQVINLESEIKTRRKRGPNKPKSPERIQEIAEKKSRKQQLLTYKPKIKIKAS